MLDHFTAEPDQNDEEMEDIDSIKKEGGASCTKSDKDAAATSNAPDKKDTQANAAKVDKDAKDAQRAKELKINESELVRDLKIQLK